MTEEDSSGVAFVPRGRLQRQDKPLPEPDVIVYGLLPFDWYRQWEEPYLTDDDGRVYFFEDVTAASKMHETAASLFVLPFEGAASIGTKGRIPSAPSASCDETQFAALCKAIPLTLRKGGLVCFVIRQDTPFPYSVKRQSSYGHEKEASQEVSSFFDYHENVIGFRLLVEASLRLTHTWLHTDLQPRMAELEPFLQRYAVANYEIIGAGRESVDGDITVLAAVDSDGVAAVAREVDKGMVVWLPLRNPTDEKDFVASINALTRCLATFRSRQLAEEPEWVREQFIWSGEHEVRESEREAIETLETIDPEKQRFSKLRRILWTRDRALQADVTWLLQEMKLEIGDEERYREDFWLLSDGKRTAIGEVKGVNGNVTPSDLAHVVSHRKQAGKDDDFPALFIANTFANTEKVEKRQIEPNVRQRAKADNVLVMRTLDLARFYDGMVKGLAGFTLDDFWALLRSGGGWLQVDDEDATRLQTA